MHHLNWVELTVKFGEKKAEMTLAGNELLDLGHLVDHISLMTENPSHAACVVLKRTDWGTLCPSVGDIKPLLSQNIKQTLCLAPSSGHLLWLAPHVDSWDRIIIRNDSVSAHLLLSTIRFVHVTRAQRGKEVVQDKGAQ